MAATSSSSVTIQPELKQRAKTSHLNSSEGNIDVVSFGVNLSKVTEGGEVAGSKTGIVGTLSFLGNTVMIWIGWGQVLEEVDERNHSINGNGNIGCGIPEKMGPMVVAMPRTKYSGFGSDNQSPCSQLIASPDEEEMMIGWHMASRLSRKFGCPIYASTALGSNHASVNTLECGAIDGCSVQTAAAFAEREIGEILMKRRDSEK